MRALLAGIMVLAASVGPALAATCYRENPAGGKIPYECVRGEELNVDAPGPVQSNLPTMNEGELDVLKQLMEGPKAAPVQAVPAQR
jgi:hypothetical protein